MKKRSVMKQGLSFLFVMWMVLCLVVFAAQAKDIKPKEAQYIILIIGDGMNIEHEIAASRYLYGKDFELSSHKLPYQANVATWDVTTYNYWSGGTYDPNAINPKYGYYPAIGGASVPMDSPLRLEPGSRRKH